MTVISVITALIIAFLSGLGIGGGGLFATYLAIFTPLSQLSVQGFNLVFFLFCAGASVAAQLLIGRKISFLAVLIMAVSGLLGALLGSFLSVILPEEYLRKIFGMLLVASGTASLGRQYSKKSSTDKDKEKNKASKDGNRNSEKADKGL